MWHALVLVEHSLKTIFYLFTHGLSKRKVFTGCTAPHFQVLLKKRPQHQKITWSSSWGEDSKFDIKITRTDFSHYILKNCFRNYLVLAKLYQAVFIPSPTLRPKPTILLIVVPPNLLRSCTSSERLFISVCYRLQTITAKQTTVRIIYRRTTPKYKHIQRLSNINEVYRAVSTCRVVNFEKPAALVRRAFWQAL